MADQVIPIIPWAYEVPYGWEIGKGKDWAGWDNPHIVLDDGKGFKACLSLVLAPGDTRGVGCVYHLKFKAGENWAEMESRGMDYEFCLSKVRELQILLQEQVNGKRRV